MWLLSKSATAVRREFQRVVVERPTFTDMPCVRVLIPANPSRERSEGIKFACRCSAALNGEASGLAPEVLHWVRFSSITETESPTEIRRFRSASGIRVRIIAQ